MTSAEIERAALAFRCQVLSLAAQQDLSVNVVVVALADVLADLAVQADMTEREGSGQGRMDAFCRRFEQTYRMVRDVRETAELGKETTACP